MTKNKDDKKAYIYESHLGGLYISDEEIPDDDLYCETCGDDDSLIFEMECFDDIEYLLNFLFQESYSLNEIFELLEDFKKHYDEEESIEYYKERFTDKVIQYASELKDYDKTFED